MQYTNGLVKDEFLQYMFAEFPDTFSNSFSREMLENIVNYGTADNFTHTKNDLFYFLMDMIPEVEARDLVPFMDREMLTDEVLAQAMPAQDKGERVKDKGVVRTMEELKGYLEENGWKVSDSPIKGAWEIGRNMPDGDGWGMTIKHGDNVEGTVQCLREIAEMFDAKAEAEIWAAEEGKRRPSKALVEALEEVGKKLKELVEGVTVKGAVKEVDGLIADAEKRVEDVDSGKEVCKVNFRRVSGYGFEEINVFLDIIPEEYRQGKIDFSLTVDERIQAYGKAVKVLGEGISDFVIFTAEMVGTCEPRAQETGSKDVLGFGGKD